MNVSKLEPIKRSTMTALEVAEYLGVSRDMIYIMAREKRIPHFRIGSRILFKRDVIDHWTESQMIEDVEGHSF